MEPAAGAQPGPAPQRRGLWLTEGGEGDRLCVGLSWGLARPSLSFICGGVIPCMPEAWGQCPSCPPKLSLSGYPCRGGGERTTPRTAAGLCQDPFHANPLMSGVEPSRGPAWHRSGRGLGLPHVPAPHSRRLQGPWPEAAAPPWRQVQDGAWQDGHCPWGVMAPPMLPRAAPQPHWGVEGQRPLPARESAWRGDVERTPLCPWLKHSPPGIPPPPPGLCVPALPGGWEGEWSRAQMGTRSLNKPLLEGAGGVVLCPLSPPPALARRSRQG